VVGGAAYAAGRHRRSQNEYDDGGQYDDTGEYEQPSAQAPAPAAPAGVDYDELKQLGELHAAGTLTDEEFAAAKAKILGN
jgi:hypothetical protein